MKKAYSKIVSLTFLSLVFTSLFHLSFSDSPQSIHIYTEDIKTDENALVIEGEIFIPLSFLKSLGVESEWKSDGIVLNSSKMNPDKDKELTSNFVQGLILEDAVYTGEVKAGVPYGNGMKSFFNGEVYKGQFVDGHAEGTGKYFFNDKSTYEGEFKKGVKEGMGKRHYPDGSAYYGEWKQGLWNGYGSYSDDSGTTIAIWEDSLFIKYITKKQFSDFLDENK